MSESIILEQSTKIVSQLVDDYERLQQEFLNLNLEEIVEGKNALYSAFILSSLNNIRLHNQSAYTFLEAMRLALEEEQGFD